MRPDHETNNAFVYCMAVSALKTNVSVVCFGTASNHYHAVVVDNQGRLPEFLGHFHKLFAKHQNALRGRWEAFWASEQSSFVELPNGDDVLAKMVYAVANPVSSHLVDKVHHWPGAGCLRAIEEDLPLVARKPSRFFDPSNDDLPGVVQLQLRRAPGFEDLTQIQYAKLLRDNVAQAEAKAAAERLEKGIRIVGRKAILRQHWNASPNTREPRRGLSPRVACKSKWARIEAIQRNQAFLDLYRGARADHLAGREAVFPAGTWWLRRFAGLKTAECAATAVPS